MDNSQLEAELKVIVKKVIEGDTTAFRYIIDQYKTLAFTTAFRIVKNKEDAEEITQDAFLKAFKALPNFNWNAGFSSWLFRIVYNTALTKIRKKNISTEQLDEIREKSYLQFSENGKAWEQIRRQERERYIRLAMDQLSMEDNLVLTLYYVGDHTLPEISEITGFGRSAVKVRLHRARKRLHKELLLLLNNEANDLL
jgi:RNA polymerase sigma factor (sigma-70 family)